MIYVNGEAKGVISLIWETALSEIGGLKIRVNPNIYHSSSKSIDVYFGEPGNLQRITAYSIYRDKTNLLQQREIIAHEFGAKWHERTMQLWHGPAATAIQTMIQRIGDKSGEISVTSAQREYAQNESNIAFLYRLSGTKTVHRDTAGRICINQLPSVQLHSDEIIRTDFEKREQKSYVASGVTPNGQLFEVKAGEGTPVRVNEVFHYPHEAREVVEVLYHMQSSRSKLIFIGKPNVRAGSTILLPDGTEHLVTRCKHEVEGNKWVITANITNYLK